jgi:hypothetical protein
MRNRKRVYCLDWRPHWRVLFWFKFSMELWYNTINTGEVKYHLFSIGWFIRPNVPRVTILSFILLGLSIRIGINTGRKPT